jgi:predicted small lipoprotein YifL
MMARAVRQALGPATLVLALLATAACGSKSRPPAAAPPDAKPDAKIDIELTVQSTEKTNDGRPLHVVVRAVDRETWAADSYASIADLVSRKDASVLATFVVFPGHQAEATLQVSARNPIAVYFLFTRPGKPWRKLVDAPLARRIELRLASASIQEGEPREEAGEKDGD